MFLDDTTVSTYNSSSSNPLDVSMSATKNPDIGETAKIAHLYTWLAMNLIFDIFSFSRLHYSTQSRREISIRAPLKIQFSSQYGVTRKKLSLTYQLYAALKFFTRALSCLET